MTSSRPHAQVRERIERLCRSSLDDRSLRAQILGELKRAVGFDAHVWLLTDPATTVGSAPLADVPCLPQLPTLIRLKYLTTVNRWSALLAARTPVALLHESTMGDLTRSRMWRELLHSFGIRDVASVVLADSYGCWGFLDLWRIDGEPFSAPDAELLTDIAAPVCRALRRQQAMAFGLASTATSPVDGPAVLIMNDDLQIIGRTTAATQWLRALLPTASDRSPVPAAALNVAAQLLAIEAGVDDHPAVARASVSGRTWVTLRASRLESTNGTPQLAVSIEETPAGSRLDLFARCHGLSAREKQLLTMLARGADTGEIAGAMHIADYTVQDHLKSIFAKTSLTSRGAVITTALGPRGDG